MEEFVNSLHASTKVLSTGIATVLGNDVDAVEVRNLYGQVIVWGMFSTYKEKFKGKLANNANTENVVYRAM